MSSGNGLALNKNNVQYGSLIEDIKKAKAIYTDDAKYTGALIKEINRILYKAVDQ
jgi:hypothetical protein